MAIATRPKPPAHARKRQARHHRQSKTYLKAYHPYLPVLAVVGLGVLANNFLDGVNFTSPGLAAVNSPVAATRVQVLTGQADWALPAVVVITAVAAIVFAATHWYRFRRLVSRGETFVMRHSWFDVVLLAILTTGIILTRSA